MFGYFKKLDNGKTEYVSIEEGELNEFAYMLERAGKISLVIPIRVSKVLFSVIKGELSASNVIITNDTDAREFGKKLIELNTEIPIDKMYELYKNGHLLIEDE